MTKQYTWDSVSRRLAAEAKKMAERNARRPDGGNCSILTVSIIVGCNGVPIGLIHPELSKLEPIGEKWVVEAGICGDI